jgi:hypothetical protein
MGRALATARRTEARRRSALDVEALAYDSIVRVYEEKREVCVEHARLSASAQRHLAERADFAWRDGAGRAALGASPAVAANPAAT